jgi:uncharacterized protein (DUF58 family)
VRPMASRRIIPSRAAVVALGLLALLAAIALALGVALPEVVQLGALALAAGGVWAVADLWRTGRAWGRAPVRIERALPHAFALGVSRPMSLTLVNEGQQAWQVEVFDELDPLLDFEGLPQRVRVPAAQRVNLSFRVTPRQRGAVSLGRTHLRLRTLGGCFDVLFHLGQVQTLHVYPNFAAVARYAWLAGDRRLSQIGIKSYAQRGMGTDFKQLSDYKMGDPVRHIDWKATLRHGSPIVREFQDERDQCVLFMLDCGRRMRASEGQGQGATSHFDEALNALMLMSYVALKEGDEVGAMTFGTAPGQQRHFAPRKGGATLNALMARFHDIEPDTSHSDYIAAAQDVLRRQHKRALVIMLTNFRDEDAAELQPALKLLRGRHLVLVASLRERVLRDIGEQAMREPHHAAEVATAHLFEQSRRDAFVRTVGKDALSVDVEPAQLAATLVNRYHAVKRAGLL